MSKALASYVAGQWVTGQGRRPLHNPTTEEVVAEAGTEGVDFAGALTFAREQGGAALRALSFAERAALLGKMSACLHEHRDELIALAIQNGGNTRGDAKFDIDGATATLTHYAGLAEQLTPAPGLPGALVDGDLIQLARNPRFVGRHLFVPRQGVAVHINAFNFPAWGFAEKAAVALLAGMPVLTKPATSTALVAEQAVRYLIEADILPAGALSMICGSAGNLLDLLGPQDVVAFTGSGDTAATIRATENLRQRSVRINVEADSLNSALLGPDVDEDSSTYDLFIHEVARDITQKVGQKCTAIRRVLVPAARKEAVLRDLAERVAEVKVGDPSVSGVKMGPIVTDAQRRDVIAGIERLAACTEAVLGSGGRGTLTGVEGDRGYFVEPTLRFAPDARAEAIHDREIFGPVATVMTYDDSAADAVDIIARGMGSLVASVYSDDLAFVTDALTGMAPHHGRLHLGSARIAEHSPGPGTVLPHLVHGGPGRAGAGEELGGPRGLAFYMQRLAVQGAKPMLSKLFG